jgi:hypothetical protein
MPDAVSHDEHVRFLLAEVQHDLRGHMEREEGALLRIEKLLDGNGQPGLVRGHVSLDERLKSLESWKVWLVGFMVTTALGVAAMLVQVGLALLHGKR